MTKKKKEFGSWVSPISAELVAKSGMGSGALPKEIQIDQGIVHWVSPQPEEDGRYVINSLHPDGSISILTPQGYSARSRVHEYGGGVYCVDNGTIVFVNDDDQRIYRQETNSPPTPIYPASPADRSHRFADGSFSPDGQWMLWVRERHEIDKSVHNEIVLIPLDGSQAPQTLVSGHDFFSNPRFSPEGDQISWLCWDHPNMPWDATELWTAKLDPDQGKIEGEVKVAGKREVSIFQPEWGLDGMLYFVSDQTGWWNIYRVNPEGLIENLCPMQAEFGYPQWLFGFTKYAFLSESLIIASYKSNGLAGLGLIDLNKKTL